MFENLLITLLKNTILLLSLGALYDYIALKPKSNSLLLRTLSGILIGLIGVAVISSPWSPQPGIIVDARSILLSISGLFFAPFSTLIALTITLLFRVYLGGIGMYTGIALIITSAGTGIFWQKFRPKFRSGPYRNPELYIFSMIVTISMLGCIWLLLPPPEGPELLRTISIPILIMFPIAGVLLGHLLIHQRTRKKTYQKLQESEENLRRVVQNMPVMLDAFDENNNIIVWNKECERVTGYAAEEIVNNPDALAMLYPDPEQRKRIIKEYAGPQENFIDVEFTLTAKDGTPKTISWSSSLSDISIPGWHFWAIGVEVTARISAMAALEKSESQYRRIVETAEEGIWMIDAENITVFVNQKMADLLGYQVEEMIGSGLFDFMDERGIEDAKENLKRRRQGISDQHDFRFTHKNGQDVWTLISTSPIFDEGDHYQGSLAMISDISGRKRAEEELQLHKDRLQKSQEIGRVGSWEYNLVTDEIWASDEGFHIYGIEVPSDNALPIDIIETFIPEKEMVHQALIDLINEEKPYDLEFEIRPPHGRFTIITSKAELIKNETGTPIKVSGVIQDVTERKLAAMEVQQLNAELEQKVEERTAQLITSNEALQEAMRTRDAFLANMSHELRTPLTAILGMSEILEEQLRGPLNERQMHFVRNIYSSGEHLLQLINDVLDLSKMEAKFIKLDVQKLDLRDICEASLAFVQKQAKDKHLKFQYTQETRSPVIEADGRRLKQILINLLSNAVKFTPDHGNMGLEVKDDPEDEKMVQFIVWDTGIGISAEDQNMLFQPFVQVDSNLNRSYEGTGLGLVLVSRITDLHKGQVNLESKPGQGTRVTVRLPYRQDI
jgi:PAS domain S-box-containing protein